VAWEAQLTGPIWAWLRLWASLDPLDRWLAALRGVAVAGGLAWLTAHMRDHPMDAEAHRGVLGLLAAFVGYSGLLYVVHARHPGRLPLLYRVVMGLDLVFIFMLVRLTGGMESSFYLAFYLLIALHAFYFGLATGGALAVTASLLYLVADSWPLSLHQSDLALRLGFFFLVGLGMGGLAERERRERRLVEELNRRLQAEQRHLQEAQDQLIRSDRLATVGELAAGLAHDLRNPLAGISGALHVLEDDLPRGPHHTVIEEIQGHIARMDRTLTDLLWHARPPAPQYLPLDVNEVVEQSLWLLPTASDAGVEIVRELRPELPLLRLDPNLLHQAFLNILINARQAMPDGGRLTVRTALRPSPAGAGSVVEVAITDTGVGIPAEHLPRIFEPFFTTKTQGTGLGLAIAARIVEQHGGSVAVESSPGHGTTFRLLFRLPPAGTEASPWPHGSSSSTTNG
jgi:signal transduction histidine kinase